MSLDKFDEDLQIKAMEALLVVYPEVIRAEKLREMLEATPEIYSFNVSYLLGKKLLNKQVDFEDRPRGEEEVRIISLQLSAEGIDMLRSLRSRESS